MPDLGTFGPYHPHAVHFVVALTIIGVAMRLISLTGRLGFAGPAAATLLLLSAAASIAAVKSGEDAHGPVERVPGARDAVVEHEDWGKRTRAMLLFVAGAELVALGLMRLGKARYAHIASAVLGLGALFCLYEAAEHGGELVYGYAGGVGLQRKDPADVGRLLLAGIYHQAQLDRQMGRSAEAAGLIDLAAQRHPGDVEVQLLRVESQLLDRKDPAAALAALAAIQVPADNLRLRMRHTFLLADALAASGQKDGARAAIQGLGADFADDPRVKRKLEELGAN